MLKFEFDEDKQRIFLNFWKIKKISDFSQVAANPDLLFLRLCLLNDLALKWLGQILANKTSSEKWDIPEYPPFPKIEKTKKNYPAEITNEVIEMLDSIHVINSWQPSSKRTITHVLSREILNTGGETEELHDFTEYQLTEEFESCFRTLSHYPNFPESFDLLKPFKSLSREEKKTLSRFQEFYGFTSNQILLHHSEESLLGLKEKGYIGFFFLSRVWTPAAVVNPIVFPQLDKKSSSPQRSSNKKKDNPFPREELAEAMFFLQVLKYEQAGMTSLPKYYPSSQERKNFLENIFQSFSELSEKSWHHYHSLDFPNRLLFLIKKSIPLGYRFLEIFLKEEAEWIMTNLKKGLEEAEIIYELNRRSFLSHPTGQEYFSPEEVREVLHAWTSLGLMIKRQQVFYGDPDIFSELKEILGTKRNTLKEGKGNPQTQKPAQNIIIDSDFTLIATKEQIRSEEIFFLYHICDLKISPHLIRGQLNPEKSSLAWYFNFTQAQLIDFFKTRSESTWGNFKEMLEIYFEHTPFFKITPTLYLSTPSKNFFLTLKYFLEDHGFASQVTMIEEKKSFIFHESHIFEKVKQAFPDPAPVKFFVND